MASQHTTNPWPTRTQQHSQFDIYPQKLMQTDHKLKQVQQKLAVMINSIVEKRKKIQQNLLKNNVQHIDAQINNGTHRNGSQNIVSDNHKDNKKQQKSYNEIQLSQNEILKLIQIWAKQDHIDLITKQQMEKTVTFYQNKLAQSQARYNQMKQYYAQLQQQTKHQVNFIKRILSRKNSALKEDQPKQDKKQNNQENININNNNSQQTKEQIQSIKKQSSLAQSAETKEQSKPFQQLIRLQKQIQQLTNLNSSLQQKLQNYPNIQKQLAQLKQQITQKTAQIQQLNTSLNEVRQKLLVQDAKYKQLQTNLTTTQQKLQVKQKQLLKYIHSQSSFAAEQLTNLQAALVSQKQQHDKQKLQHDNKLKILQQQIRQLTFTCENYKQQNQALKNENQYLTQIKQQNQVKQVNSTDQIGSQNNVQVPPHHTMTEPAAQSQSAQQIPKTPPFITTKSSIIDQRKKTSIQKDNNDGSLQQQLDSAGHQKIDTIIQQQKKQQMKSNKQLSLNINNQNSNNLKNEHENENKTNRKQSCSQYLSAASTLKRSKYKLSIQHTFGLQQYYLKAKQVSKQKYPINQSPTKIGQRNGKQQQNSKQKNNININKMARSLSPVRHNRKRQQEQIDILGDDNQAYQLSNQNNNNQIQNIFTKVISVKQHTQHLSQSSRSNIKGTTNQPHFNLQIASQILLVPSSSVDQITGALWTLHQKLRDIQAVIKQNNLQYGIKPQKRKWSQEVDNKTKQKQQQQQNISMNKKGVQKAAQQQLKTTTFPGQQQVIKKQKQNKQSLQNLNDLQRQKAIKKMSSLDIDLEGLNKQIYYSTKQLYQLCQALMSNFEDQIINRQTQEVKDSFKDKGVNKNIKIANNKQNNQQKKVQQKQKQKQKQHKQQQKDAKKDEIKPQQPQKLTIQVPQTWDYQAGFKLINTQIKNLFQTFFNDSKLFKEQDQTTEQAQKQQAQHQHIKQEQVPTPQDIKNEDEKSILQILKKLTLLHQQLSRKRKQISAKNKQKVQRLFDVIRSMIINFKISYKSMNNILIAKQIGNSLNKYMHLRLYLNSLYKILQQQRGGVVKGNNINVNDTSSMASAPTGSSNQINTNTNTNHPQSQQSAPAFTVYESYQDKLQKLNNQLSKLRLQLDHKNQQFQSFKQLASTYIQTKKQGSQQQIKNHEQHKTHYDKQQKQQNIQQSTLNKVQIVQDHIDQNNINGNPQSQPENIQYLKNQLVMYKKKCAEYQQTIGPKKKKQRIIYIRR